MQALVACSDLTRLLTTLAHVYNPGTCVQPWHMCTTLAHVYNPGTCVQPSWLAEDGKILSLSLSL